MFVLLSVAKDNYLSQSDNDAKCFEKFVRSLNRAPSDAENPNEISFNITAETHLLVETKDIRDQLEILGTVLTDQ